MSTTVSSVSLVASIRLDRAEEELSEVKRIDDFDERVIHTISANLGFLARSAWWTGRYVSILQFRQQAAALRCDAAASVWIPRSEVTEPVFSASLVPLK